MCNDGARKHARFYTAERVRQPHDDAMPCHAACKLYTTYVYWDATAAVVLLMLPCSNAAPTFNVSEFFGGQHYPMAVRCSNFIKFSSHNATGDWFGICCVSGWIRMLCGAVRCGAARSLSAVVCGDNGDVSVGSRFIGRR